MKDLLFLSLFLFAIGFVSLHAQADSTQASEPDPSSLYDTIAAGAFYVQPQPNGLRLINDAAPDGYARLSVNGEERIAFFERGQAALSLPISERGQLYYLSSPGSAPVLCHLSSVDGSPRLRNIPLWLSLLPPLIAILMALVFREVVVSLFVGIWVGAFIVGGMRIDSLYLFILSFLEVVEKYIIEALVDSGHMSVIVFSLLIGGMVAIISRNGGMAGIVERLSRYARSDRSSQFITWVLGVAIFFDDYANTLIVGNTMRSVTDRFRISREKLAYIVDSTAAPVASVAFITTWIGAELGYIDDGISGLKGFDASLTPYAIFLESLKYSFYPVLTLGFILMLVYLRRDYGPMYRAEIRARNTGQLIQNSGAAVSESELRELEPVEGAPHKWYNAFFPVLTVIAMTIYGLLDTGISATYGELLEAGTNPASSSWGAVWSALSEYLPEGQNGIFPKLGKLIGNADSYVALLWSSLSGVVLAIVLSLGGRIMRLTQSIDALVAGFKTMMPALIILVLAWSLASTIDALHTADLLSASVQEVLSPYWAPAIIFVMAALISFSTGSSWSTMAILYPIAIPATWALCQAAGMDASTSNELLFNVISIVLGASVLGDHCSPISDTTILSSLASHCNHIDHVRTQLPYALTVGLLSISAGTVSTMLGGGWGISALLLLIAFGLLLLVVWKVGKKVPEARA